MDRSHYTIGVPEQQRILPVGPSRQLVQRSEGEKDIRRSPQIGCVLPMADLPAEGTAQESRGRNRSDAHTITPPGWTTCQDLLDTSSKPDQRADPPVMSTAMLITSA